jgi:hypothetical protein
MMARGIQASQAQLPTRPKIRFAAWSKGGTLALQKDGFDRLRNLERFFNIKLDILTDVPSTQSDIKHGLSARQPSQSQTAAQQTW